MIKIFTMTHKPFGIPKDNIYIPLHVGRSTAKDLGYLGDDTGDNISALNKYYGELTGVYWIWKNVSDADIVGVCHYRRYFFNQEGERLKESEIKNILSEYDVMVSNKVVVENNYKDFYGRAHNVNDLLMVGEVIKEKSPDYFPFFEAAISGNTCYCGNLIIAPLKTFKAYTEWLFDILFEVEKRIDISNYDLYRQRVFGFLSEQMLKIWVDKNQLKVYEGRIGITDDKAETKELKLGMSQLIKLKEFSKAGEMFHEFIKIRPDITLKHSDLEDELPIIENLLFIAEMEQERNEPGLILNSLELSEWISHYRRVWDCLENFARGKRREEDISYMRETHVTGIMVEIMLTYAIKPLEGDVNTCLEMLAEV